MSVDRVSHSVERRILAERFDYFLGRLRDISGRPFEVATHHRQWC